MTYTELIKALLDSKKKIISFTISITLILALILVFIYPITYSSSVKVLPPDENNMSGVAGLLGGTGISSLLGMGGSSGNSQLYAEIVKSRTVLTNVIKQNNLLNYFDVDKYETMEEKYIAASQKLYKVLGVEVTKEGILIVSTRLSTGLFCRFSSERDSINKLTAQVTNSIVEELDKVNRSKLNQKARRTRVFIETQIEDTRVKMSEAENKLEKFQEDNKAISIPDQMSAAIENAAKVKSEIVLTEIKLATLEYNVRKDSPEYLNLLKELDVLKQTYKNFETGKDGEKDFLLSFNDVPKLSLQYANLLREVKIQNEVYKLLQMQYYQEKIQETKDVPTISVLDSAVPALKASSPRLLFHTFAGGLLAFSLICSLIIFREFVKYFSQKKELKK